MEDIRRTFHEHLEDVQNDIVRLAAMATEAIPRATAALLDRDLEATQQLIDDDDAIDVLTLDIEERIYDLIVRQSPVASDLRTLLSSLWMTSEIERSADLRPTSPRGHAGSTTSSSIPSPGGSSPRLARRRRACSSGDRCVHRARGWLAIVLDGIDDRLDLLHGEFIQSLFEHQPDSGLQPAVQLALIGRYYERIGDHAVNMGERVAYMVTGSFPDHVEDGSDAGGDDAGHLRAVEPDPDAAGS